MPKQTVYNTGIYVRLSQEDMREGESLSIEHQKMILTKYVTEQGWTLIDVYVDDGYSGTDFNRPGVMRLLDDAKAGKINLIIVKDLSRFGRNYIEVGLYVDYIFPAYNIRFIALNDNVDTANKDSAAMDMMPIVNLFNEWHCASTSRKIRAVMVANAKAGKYKMTYACYGYIKSDDENHTPVIDPESAEVVRRIFTMRSQGCLYRYIADTLNSEHIPCPSDYHYNQVGFPVPALSRHLWCAETIGKILKNQTYLGHLVQQKFTSVSYKNHKFVKRDPSEWVIIEHNHEPIISQELWDKCREVDASVSRGKRSRDGSVRTFSGMMYCIDCGHKLNCSSKDYVRKGGRVENFVWYNCISYVTYGKTACCSHYLREDVIKQIVLSDIREKAEFTLADEEKARKVFLAHKGKVRSKQAVSENKKLRDNQRRIAELDDLMQTAYEDKVKGEMPESVCVKLLKKYENEQAKLTEETAALEKKIAERKQNEDNIDEFIARIKKYSELQELSREVVLELIEYITVDKHSADPRNIHIYYKFLDDPLKNKRALYITEN